MIITDVRIRKIASEGKMKAIVSVTFENQFVVHDIKIIEGQNGLFIAMPSRKTPDGEFKDIAHPINAQARERLQNAILSEYEAVLGDPLEVLVANEGDAGEKQESEVVYQAQSPLY